MHRFALVLLLLVTALPASAAGRGDPLVAYASGRTIVLADPVAGTRRILLRSPDKDTTLSTPTWSPDGSRIAFVNVLSGWIAVVDVRSGHVRRVSLQYDEVVPTGLRWSPDGRRVAYVGDGTVRLAAAGGRSDRRLWPVTDTRRRRVAIVGWTPDGRLVFRSGGARLSVRPRHGRPQVADVRFPRPAAAPDGASLAIVRDRRGNDQVAIDTASGRRLLTADRALPGRLPVRDCCPRWSPDGRWIAFVRGGDVAVVGAGGQPERLVLEDAGIAGWSPDGSRLLVSARHPLRALWAYDPARDRTTLLRRVRENGLSGAAWRPGAAPAFVLPAAGRPHARTVETALPRSAFRPGRVRIREIRRLRADGVLGPAAVSPDGRTLITVPQDRLTALDLATGRSLRLRGPTLASWWSLAPGPSGSVLYRHGHALWTASWTTGRARLVARDAGGSFRWLAGGGIAYVDRRLRLVVLRPDGTVRSRRGLGGPGSGIGDVAISPRARLVLLTKNCDVWLRNVATGRMRRLARLAYAPSADSWSPDGTHVALSESWSTWGCGEGFDWYHSHIALFDLRGRQLDVAAGSVADWSPDGRFLLTQGGVTGGGVGNLEPLVLEDLRTRRRSTLLPRRSVGPALFLPDGRVLFGRYDDPAERRTRGYDPHLYVGRLVGR